jgi:hypothetical protein
MRFFGLPTGCAPSTLVADLDASVCPHTLRWAVALREFWVILKP